MKKQFTNILRHLSLALATAVALTACIKDSPKNPDDEIKNKLHEDPVKAVFTLTEATLPTGLTFDYSHIGDIALTQNKQVITFAQQKNAAFERTADSPEGFNIKTEEQSPNTVYQLSVQYFNVKGELMNNQFVDNAQDKIHQHFFSLYKNNRIVRDVEQIPYKYLYADKDKSGAYMGETNPIGLEGFFRFTRAIGQEVISVDFRHFFNSKFGTGGAISPYYAASRETASNSDLDVSLKLQFSDGTDAGDDDSDDNGSGTDNGGGSTTIPEVSTEQLNGRFPGINTTNVRKIKLTMYEGHIHEPASYHYVPGPKGFNHKSLSYEQDMTLEYRGGEWVVTSGDKFFLFNRGVTYPDYNRKHEPIPAPVYGLWVEYYDEDDDLINSEFAAKGAYQTFFRPSNIKQFSDGAASSYKPSQIMGYMYRDTAPWNGTAREGATYTDTTDPVGLKGFFYFNQRDVKFALNLELWQTPQGKLTAGKPASFLEPSEHIKKTGKPVLSVSIPSFVWLTRAELDNYEDTTTLEELSSDEKSVMIQLGKLLNLSWEQIIHDLMLRIEGERGGENTGRWF